jgi:hypothetical protein
MTLYKCDPEKYPECKKTDCGVLKKGSAECFCTIYKEHAALDEKGNPIIKDKWGYQ